MTTSAHFPINAQQWTAWKLLLLKTTASDTYECVARYSEEFDHSCMTLAHIFTMVWRNIYATLKFYFLVGYKQKANVKPANHNFP